MEDLPAPTVEPSPMPEATNRAAEEGVVTNDNKARRAGYGQPPVESRFKPGQSGHPAGRPRGAVGFRTALRRACEANNITPEQLMVGALTEEVAAALQRDPKARDRVLRWLEKHCESDAASE